LIHRGSLARLSARAKRWAEQFINRGQLLKRTFYLVGKHHQAPVSFPAENTTNALSGVSHGVETKKF
jgi:hypothetical protein